jgi:cell division protein FtsI/penicillin-binding protein 2
VINYSDTILQRRRLAILILGLVAFGVVLALRLFYLQVWQHSMYLAEATSEHTHKYDIPARRGELYVHDGDGRSPVALNQQLNILYADPSYISAKARGTVAQQLAAATGAKAAEYQRQIASAATAGSQYVVLADHLSNDLAAKVKALNLAGVGLTQHDYRTYPEGSLAAQVLGFVNANDQGQYGIEQYLNDELAGKPGRLAAKTDTRGIPIATADNVQQAPVDGRSYVLTIDRNIQAMAESELAKQVQAVHAASGSVIVMDPTSGAIRAMASYPTFDPNNYSKVSDYNVFLNQAVDVQFEPGSGMKVFTMAAGLDQGKVTPDTTYDDPGCYHIDDRNVCNAEGDKPGPNKTMTTVLKDSLNTGVMFVLRKLGANPDKLTLAGKQLLYNYFTQHFGFGERTGVEQANEVAGAVNPASNAAGNDVNYANMSFGQGVSVTMVQMVAAMAAIANGGKLYQPHLVDAQLSADGAATPVAPKLVRDHVISQQADQQLNQMLQIVVQHGSGYIAHLQNPGYNIGGKTGTAQIPKPDGSGYIDGANVGSFTGYAPAENPKFVVMVRIDRPGVSGYAETTTVPVFSNICKWLFKYYGIPPSS